MYSSIEKVVGEDEQVEETVHPSVFDTLFFKRYFYGIVLLLFFVALPVAAMNYFELPFNPLYLSFLAVLPLIYLVLTEIRRRFKMYHFTDQKIVMESGILDKKWTTINYSRITHVDMHQDFEERIFGVSDLHVFTAGEDETELDLNGLKEPYKFKKMISNKSSSNDQPAN